MVRTVCLLRRWQGSLAVVVDIFVGFARRKSKQKDEQNLAEWAARLVLNRFLPAATRPQRCWTPKLNFRGFTRWLTWN